MINLSQKFEYEIRGKKYVAYPLTLTKQAGIEELLNKIDENKTDTTKLTEIYVDVAMFVLKDYNEGITREEIKNNFSLVAILRILSDVVGQKTIENISK